MLEELVLCGGKHTISNVATNATMANVLNTRMMFLIYRMERGIVVSLSWGEKEMAELFFFDSIKLYIKGTKTGVHHVCRCGCVTDRS